MDGPGMLNGSNQIVRFNSETGATTLTTSSNSATTDYTTYGSTYNANGCSTGPTGIRLAPDR